MCYVCCSNKIKCLITVFIYTLCFVIVLKYVNIYGVVVEDATNPVLLEESSEKKLINEFYERRQNWSTSKLGSILFQNASLPGIPENMSKNYHVMIYKQLDFLRDRNIYFSSKSHPLIVANCSVTNCRFSKANSNYGLADAVLVDLTADIHLSELILNRNPHQRLIFFYDTSPRHVNISMGEWANVFNWSMSFRTSADIPVPFGRTVPLEEPILNNNHNITSLIPFWNIKTRDILVGILLTDCYNKEHLYILQRWKNVKIIDIYYRCRNNDLINSCSSHYKSDCQMIGKYLFYLVLEESKCKEYMTEKLFYYAYSRGAIPIIQGPTLKDCERLLPPNSYLHIDSYPTIEDLINDVLLITDEKDKLLSYHAWRNNYAVINEHGYYGSKFVLLCRICEALNYNDRREKVYKYNDLGKFLNPRIACRP